MADIGAATLGLGTLGYGIYQGRKAEKMQKEALKEQKLAQGEATARAERQQRLSEEAMNRANRKAPDVNAIMQAAQEVGSRGMSSTMLTGTRGVDPASLLLARSTLLGE